MCINATSRAHGAIAIIRERALAARAGVQTRARDLPFTGAAPRFADAAAAVAFRSIGSGIIYVPYAPCAYSYVCMYVCMSGGKVADRQAARARDYETTDITATERACVCMYMFLSRLRVRIGARSKRETRCGELCARAEGTRFIKMWILVRPPA